MTAEGLAQKLLRFAPYWRDGGVTASGGEPLLQAAFAADLFETLKANGAHTALDTSGCLWNRDAERLLSVTDLVLLDIKQTTSEAYEAFSGIQMEQPLAFLEQLEARGKPTWIRHVVIPGVTDGEENMRRLAQLLAPFACIEKLELLPFRKLCLEKYDAMGVPFPLKEIPEATEESIEQSYLFYRRHAGRRRTPMKKVAVMMGSDSDLPVVEKAVEVLRELEIPFEVHVMSAHRTPDAASRFAAGAREAGFGVILAAAGKAAHLAGALAARTTLPVVGIPVKSSTLDGLDALLSTVQMPAGVPVATVAIDGAANAALLAAQILSVYEPVLADKLQDKKTKDEKAVLVKDQAVAARYA